MKKIILLILFTYFTNCKIDVKTNNSLNHHDSVLKALYKKDFEGKDSTLKNGEVVINYFVYYADSSFNFLKNKSSEYRYKYFINFFKNRFKYSRDSVKFKNSYSYPDFQFPILNSSIVPTNFLSNHSVLASQDNLIFDTNTFKSSNYFIRLIFENKLIDKHYAEQDLVGVWNVYGDRFPTEKEFIHDAPYQIYDIDFSDEFNLIQFMICIEFGEIRGLLCTFNKKGELIDGILNGSYFKSDEKFISYFDLDGSYNIIKEHNNLFDLQNIIKSKEINYKKLNYKTTRGRFKYRLSKEGKFLIMNKRIENKKEILELNNFP